MRSRASAPASPRACASTPRSSGSRSRCSLSRAAPGSLRTAAPGSRSRRRAAPPPSPRRRLLGYAALAIAGAIALRGFGFSDSLIWPAALCRRRDPAGPVAAPALRFVVGLSLVAVGVIALRRPERDVARPRRSVRVERGRDRAPAVARAVGLAARRRARRRAHRRGSARRSAPRWPLASTTPSCRRSRSSSARRAIRAAWRRSRDGRSASCVPGSTPIHGPPTAAGSPAAIDAAAAEVEELHGVPVELVRTGDVPLDDRVEALVLAAREAMSNAAQHSGADQVSDVRRRRRGRDRALRPRPRQPASIRRRCLPSAHGIAESIRGRMDARRRNCNAHLVPGEGTEVELAPGEADMSRRRVVLVDDHDLFRAGVRSELGEAVEIVGEAGSVAEAVPLIRELDPDVVLLDVHLPGRRRPRRDRTGRARAARRAVPRAVGLGRGGGRDRRDPRRRARLRDEDDLRRGADRRGEPHRRRRRRLLAAARRLRARRVPLAATPPSTRSSTSSPRASARCCS